MQSKASIYEAELSPASLGWVSGLLFMGLRRPVGTAGEAVTVCPPPVDPALPPILPEEPLPGVPTSQLKEGAENSSPVLACRPLLFPFSGAVGVSQFCWRLAPSDC